MKVLVTRLYRHGVLLNPSRKLRTEPVGYLRYGHTPHDECSARIDGESGESIIPPLTHARCAWIAGGRLRIRGIERVKLNQFPQEWHCTVIGALSGQTNE